MNAPTLDADLALRALLPRVTSCATKADALRTVAEAIQSLSEGSALFYFERGKNGALTPPVALTQGLWDDALAHELSQALRWCDGVCAAGHPQWRRFGSTPNLRGVATPVFFRGAPPEVICWLVRDLNTASDQLEVAILHAALHLTLWQVVRQPAPAATIDMSVALAAARSATTRDAALRQLAAALATAIPCQRVAIGLTHGGAACRLAVVSDHASVDSRSELAEAIEQALDEALDSKGVVAWPSDAATAPHNLRRAASIAGAASAAACRLVDANDRPIAAMALFGLSQEPQGRQSLARLEQSLPMISAAVGLVAAAHQTAASRLVSAARKTICGRRFVVAVATAALAAGVLLIPAPYRLGCESVVEPVTRRFVAAPFAGRLETTLVEPGDVVHEGQPLARMDEREVSLELATLQAEFQQAKKRADAALAARNGAGAQVAQLEARQFALKIETMTARRDRLTIASPVAGVVVRGDLKRSEGAPLSIGQTLFEVSPLDEMVVEIAIPEEEVVHFTPGCRVELSLDALAGRSWGGAIERIHPRAELRDERQVFIAEMRLANQDGSLRPGMKGECRITGASRALGWIWLHRPWEKLRRLCRW